MRSLLLALALFSLLLPVAARAQTQSEMNAEAFGDFQAADKKMNVAYAKLMKALPDDEAQAKLKAAQIAWLKYRDTQAELEADGSRGGTIVPTLLAETKAALTDARTAELKKLAEAY